MSSAKINGIDLHYQCYGEGDAIVFAHGAGGNLLSWWQQIPFFSQRYRCVTFDHRGFGHSLDVPEGPGAAKFVDDLRGLLDHLGIESAHLVAQSMGGRTMLGFAVRYPSRVRSLVMADTVGGMNVPEVAGRAAQLGGDKYGIWGDRIPRGIAAVRATQPQPGEPVPPDLTDQPAASRATGRTASRARTGRTEEHERPDAVLRGRG